MTRSPKKQYRLLQFASQNVYFIHKPKNLSHEQLKFHAYKISLKHEISDPVSLKRSNMKIFVKKRAVKVF